MLQKLDLGLYLSVSTSSSPSSTPVTRLGIESGFLTLNENMWILISSGAV